MRFNMGATVAVLAMGAAVLAGQPVVAAGGHGGGHHGNKQIQKLDQELTLTADQKTQITAILKDSAEKRKAIRAGDATDKPTEIKALRKETMNSIKALLTPDQLAKLKTLRHEKKAAAGNGTATTPAP